MEKRGEEGKKGEVERRGEKKRRKPEGEGREG